MAALMARAALTAAAVLVVAGCATTSLPIAQMKPAPAEQIQWRDAVGDQVGTLVLARDAGLAGAGYRVAFTVDGARAAWLWPEEMARLRVPAGRITVQARATDPLFGDAHKPRSVEVTVQPGRQVVVRVGFDEGRNGFSVWQDLAQ